MSSRVKKNWRNPLYHPEVCASTIVGVIITFALSSSAQQQILSAPVGITVAFNTTANFNCHATGLFLGWRINGDSENSAQLKDTGINSSDDNNGSTLKSTLFIPATTEFNNSVVICIVAGNNSVKESDPATLKIQGLLGPPPNLTLKDLDEYHHQLQWDAPFTLDITDVDPDISGYIICNNVTTECINATEQHFQCPNLCAPVLFFVSAFNIVGTGVEGIIKYPSELYDKNPGNEMNITAETFFDTSHIPTVTLSYQESGSCYHFIDVILTSTYSNTQSMIGPRLPIVDSSGIASLNLIDLPDNDIIRAIVIEHTGGLWSLETTFSTFDITAVDAKGGDNSIQVVCIFAKGSDAQGCYVMVLSIDGMTNESYKALRELDNNASSEFTGLEPGNYSVAVFDIESDGSILLNRAAHNDTVTVDGASERLLGIVVGSVFGSLFVFSTLTIAICCTLRIVDEHQRRIRGFNNWKADNTDCVV